MGLPKGRTNNPNGRPKGALNKSTKELRAALKAIFQEELNNLPAYLASLTIKERLEVLLKLLPYVLPKCEANFYSEYNNEDNGEASPNQEELFKDYMESHSTE